MWCRVSTGMGQSDQRWECKGLNSYSKVDQYTPGLQQQPTESQVIKSKLNEKWITIRGLRKKGLMKLKGRKGNTISSPKF